ncbi:MAG: gliding motility-associated C-terminal domain-containing protein [Bacteroidetes bacterium]|nr:MAG: gliding motility-associated C-terminal domain-containing protein [Bacteroidota bacterium]
MTVRNGALGASQNGNTIIARTSGLPYYENPLYSGANYTQNNGLRDGYGFTIGVCDAGGNALGDLSPWSANPDDCNAFNVLNPNVRVCVPQNVVSTCVSSPNVRIQYAEYIRVVDLPNIPGGYHLTFRLCCRNNAVQNVNPDSYSVYARIPDAAVYDNSRMNVTVTSQNTLSRIVNSNLNISIIGFDPSTVDTYTGSGGLNGTFRNNRNTMTINAGTITGSPASTAPIVLNIVGNLIGIATNTTFIGINTITLSGTLNGTVFSYRSQTYTAASNFTPGNNVTSIQNLSFLGITNFILNPEKTILGVNATFSQLSNELAGLGLTTSLGVGVTSTGHVLNTNGRIGTGIQGLIRNSSPSFKSTPPLFVCQSNNIVEALGLNQNDDYDNGATDVDDDSLTYAIVPSFDENPRPYEGIWNGASGTNINGTVFNNGADRMYATMPFGAPSTYPNNVNLNTFPLLTYLTNYSAVHPLGIPFTPVNPSSVPGIVINTATGLLVIKPRVPAGLYVVSIRAREFKKGTGEFLGEITRDYQFRVLVCPLPALANMQGNFNFNGSSVTVGCGSPTIPIINSSTGEAFLSNTFYWDFGKDRYTDTSNTSNTYGFKQQRRILTDNVTLVEDNQIPVANTSNAANPATAFNFVDPGNYYVKLVVQNRGTGCADSAFHLVNFSTLRTRWFQQPVGDICVRVPVIFDMHSLTTTNGTNVNPVAGGITTISGNSLWTNPATNPFPLVWVDSFTGINADTNCVNFTGWINVKWAQPFTGLPVQTKRTPPSLAQRARVTSIVWDFGDGVIQLLSLTGLGNVPATTTGTNWVPISWTSGGVTTAGIAPRTTLLGFNPLTTSTSYLTTTPGLDLTGMNTMFLPRVRYEYANPSIFYTVTGTCITQYGCTSSFGRRITVIQAQPTAAATGTGVCLNNPNITLTGLITVATGGIWNGGLGTFPGTNSFAGTNVVRFTRYAMAPSELIPGNVVNLTLTSWGNGACPSASVTVPGSITVENSPQINAGPDFTVCGNNLRYRLNGIVTGSSSGGNFGGRWRILTVSGLRTGVFASSGTNSPSTILGDTYIFSTATGGGGFTLHDASPSRGFALLLLESTNNGLCSTTADTIRIGIAPVALNPTVSVGSGVTVCGNNAVFTISGTTTNPSNFGIWTTSGTGRFSSTNTSSSTVLSGISYIPSAADSIAGSLILTLSTRIITTNGSCLNVSTTVGVRITAPPRVTLSPLLAICQNNPVFTITGTFVGVSQAFFTPVDRATLLGIAFSSGSLSPNRTTLAGGGFRTTTQVVINPTSLAGFLAGNGNNFTDFGSIRLMTTLNGQCLPVSITSGIVMNPSPGVTIIPSPTAIACKNNPQLPLQAVVFGATSALRSATTVLWSASNVGVFSPSNSVLNTAYTPTPSNPVSITGTRIIVRADRSTDNCLAVFDTTDVSYFDPATVNAGPDQQICVNNLFAQLNGQVTFPATGGVWSIVTGNGTFSSTGTNTSTRLNDIYISNNADVSAGSVTLRLQTTGATIGTISGTCTPVSTTMGITFTNPPSVLFPTLPAICESNPSATISATITGAPNVTASTRGFWGGGAGTYSINNNSFTISGFSAIGSLFYTPSAAEIAARTVNLILTVNGANNCAATTASFSYNITNGPTIKIVSSNSPVCENNSAITMRGTISGASGGLWTGGTNPIVVSGNVASGFTANYTPTPAEIATGSIPFRFASQGEINNCSPVFDVTTVQINPSPVVSVGGDQVVCIQNTSTPVTINAIGSISGITTMGVWTSSGTGTFANATVNGVSIATYTPSVSDKGAATPIQIRLTSINNGSCNAVTDRFNLSFSTSPTANAGPNQVVCVNDFPISLNASGSAGGWSTIPLRPGVFGSTNAATSTTLIDTFTPPSTTPGGTIYTFRWTTNPTANCPSVTSDALVTVLSAPVVSIVVPTTTITGNDIFIPLTATGTGITGGIFATSGTGSFTSTGTSFTNFTVSPVRDTYRITPTDVANGFVNFTFTGGGTAPCSNVSTVISVLILPRITVDAGISTNLCNDATSNTLTLAGQIFYNGILTTSAPGIWRRILGNQAIVNPTSVVGAIYSPSIADKNNPPRQVSFELTATVPSGLSGFYTAATLPKDTVTFTFFNGPLVTITGAPAEVCSDVPFFNLTGTFTGTPSIVWSTTGTNTFVLDNTRTSVSYTPTQADKNAGIVRFVMLSLGSGLCNEVASNIVTVTITGKPTINAGPDELLCNNLTAITLAGAGMTVTGTAPAVTWGVSNTIAPVGSISSNIIITNGSGTNPVYFPSTRERITNKIVTVFVTAAGIGSCTAVTDSKVITFFDAPTVNLGATTETYCGDTRLITLSGVSTVAGRWTAVNGTGNLVQLASGSSGTPALYTVSGADVATLTTTLGFQYTVTFAGCNNEIRNKNIVLTTIPGVTITGSNNSLIKNPTICGDALSVFFNGVSRTGTGTWSIANPGGYSPNSSSVSTVQIGLLQSERQNAINTGNPLTVYLSSGPTGVCPARLDSAKITVTRPPQVYAGSDTTVCESVNFVDLNLATVTVASGVTWTSSSPQGRFVTTLTSVNATLSGSGQIKTVNSLIYIPGAAEKALGSVILTLSTFGSTTGGTCFETFATKTILFERAPTIAAIPNQTICASDVKEITVNASVNNQTSVRWGSSGTGNFDIPTNLSTLYYWTEADSVTSINNVVTITISALGTNLCPVATRPFRFKINPRPQINAGLDFTICEDSPGITIAGATKTLTTTGVQWTNFTNRTNTGGNFSPNANSLTPVFVPLASDVAARDIKLVLSTTGNGTCKPAVDTLYVTVLPKPVVNLGSDLQLCSDFNNIVNIPVLGSSFANVSVSGTGSGGFTITTAGLNGNIGYVPSFDDKNTTKRVTIRATTLRDFSLGTEAACLSYSDAVVLTFTGAPTLTATPQIVECLLPGKTVTFSGTISGPETYRTQWQRSIISPNSTAGTFIANSDRNFSLVTNTTSVTNAVFQVAVGDGESNDFIYNVTGLGICNNVYKDTTRLSLQKIAIITLTGPSVLCSDQTTINLGYDSSPLSGWNDESFQPVRGEGLSWTAVNSNGNSGTNFFASRFELTPSYTLTANDQNSSFIRFTASTTGINVCPNQVFTTQVAITEAPTIQSVTGTTLYCSNINTGITVSGIVTASGASFQWRSNSVVLPQGSFAGSNTNSINSITGVYNPSASEISNNLASLVFTASKAGCNNYTRPLNINIKTAPVVDAGNGGTVCSLPGIGFQLSGSITPALSITTGNQWSVVTPAGALFDTEIYTVTSGEMSVTRNTSITGAGVPSNTITYRLTAAEPGCNPVFANVVYTFAGLPVANAGSPRTVCGTDLNALVLQAGPNSAAGTWSTTGLGNFASTGTKSTTKMNDRYVPAFGEAGSVTFTLTYTPPPGGCGVLNSSSVSWYLTPGMFIKAAPKRYIAICKNKFPVLSGTVVGTSFSKWRTSGTGIFTASNADTVEVAGTLIGSFTTTGSPTLALTHYAINATYIPTQADYAAGKVLLTMESVNDGSSLCDNESKDTLSLIFTAPPSAASKADDILICGNVANTTIAGVSVSGSVLLPTPNSTDSLATPTNAAFWQVISGTGYFLSSNSAIGRTFSVSGTALNSILNVDDIYIASNADTATANQPIILRLITAYVITSTIGGAACNPAVDTLEVRFYKSPIATITTTLNGICADQTSIDVFGSIRQAGGGLWSTSGSGAISGSTNWGSASDPFTYLPSAAELSSPTPVNIVFSLSSTDNGSCFGAISAPLTVTISPKPDIQANILPTICGDLNSFTLSGTDLRNTTFTSVTGFNWRTNGSGVLSTLARNGATLPANYVVSDDDRTFGNISFTITATGQGTCKPIVRVTNILISPKPTLTLSANQFKCRDIDDLTVSANIAVATGVQWSAFRCVGGNCTIPGNGSFLLGSSTMLSGVYDPSAEDILSSVSGMLFVATTTGTYATTPSCNQVISSTGVTYEEIPTIRIDLVPNSICADTNYIELTSTLTGALQADWYTTGSGSFSPSSSTSPLPVPTIIRYDLSSAENANPFATVIGITVSTSGNGTCKTYSDNITVSITGRPFVNAGSDRTFCADIAQVSLTGIGFTNPSKTITGITTSTGIIWTSFGTGTFVGSGLAITTLLGDIYVPSASDRNGGQVVLELASTGPNPCKIVKDYMSIFFDKAPVVVVSAGIDQIICADNRLINLNGFVQNGANPGWVPSKPSGAGFLTNSFCGTCIGGRGTFAPTSNDLNASYTPSVEDTLGATKAVFAGFTDQKIIMTLTVNGLGACASNVYPDDMQVTFTSRPTIQIPVIPTICKNDIRPVTLTGLFTNPVALEGKWSFTGGTGQLSPSNVVNNPPTVTGITYTPSAADMLNDGRDRTVRFTFVTQNMGTCGELSRTVDLQITQPPKFSPAIQNFTLCESTTTLGLNVNAQGIARATWRTVGLGNFASNSTNPGANLASTSGLNFVDTYRINPADIAAGTINLFLESTSTPGCFFGDTARVILKIDKLIQVDAGLDRSVCADTNSISLTGSVLNTTRAIWTTASPASGVFSSPTTTLSNVYVPSTNDRNLTGVKLYLSSNTPSSACPAVKDSITVLLTPLPIVNINPDISICTITAIQLRADTANVAFMIWSTSGTGGFGVTRADQNPVYVPSQADLVPTNSVTGASFVKITLTTKGRGLCRYRQNSFDLELKKKPNPDVFAGSDVIVCRNQIQRLNVATIVDGVTYTWMAPINTILGIISAPGITTVDVFTNYDDSVYVLRAKDDRYGCIALDTIIIKTLTLPSLNLLPKICFSPTLTLPASASSHNSGKKINDIPVNAQGGKFQWYRGNVQLNNFGANDTTGLKADPGLYILSYTKFVCSTTDTTLVRGLPELRTNGKVVCKDSPFEMTPYIVKTRDSLVNTTALAWSNANGFINQLKRVNNGINAIDSMRFNNRVFVNWNSTYNGSNFALELNKPSIQVAGVSVDSIKYVVRVIDVTDGLSCFLDDTIRIKTHPRPIMTMKDYSICAGDVALLNAQPLTVVSPIKISYRPAPSIRDTTFFAGITWSVDGIAITTTQGNFNQVVPYTNSVLGVTESFKGAGRYIAKFQIGECIAFDTSNVSFNAKPVVKNESLVSKCIDDTKNGGFELDAGAGDFRYLWLASGNTGQKEIVYDTLKYYFKVFNKSNNCNVLDSVVVKQSCKPKVFVPGAFIPDGPNPVDRVFVVFGNYFKNYRMRIYNRWGEVIFDSKVPSDGWDGTYNGSPMPIGVYPYLIEYESQYEDQEKGKKNIRGSVTLVR